MSNCPHCMAPGRVLQTRKNIDGSTTYRRYVCVTDPKVRYSTVEVNESIVKAIGAERFKQHVARTQRGVERRSLAELRRKRVSQMIAEGHSTAQMAKELGTSPDGIRKLCRAIGLPRRPKE